jgi:hypothetical protein
MVAVGGAHTGIKVGVLFDFVFPPPSSWDVHSDFTDALHLTFDEAMEHGQLDRPVTVIERAVEGLPRGAVQAVIDAYQELVDEGCLMIIGPMISENMVALREYIDRVGHGIPCLGWGGTEDWLGEWTFAIGDGDLAQEPHVMAGFMAQAGLKRVGVTYERSLIGAEYLRYLRTACETYGLDLAVAVPIAQTEADATGQVAALKAADVDGIAHVGFGLGLLRINMALAAIGWDPPRYTTTAWENGYLNDDLFKAFAGWVGLEHFDETNTVATGWLDRFEKRYGRRPEYAYTLYGHDMGRVVAGALGDAHPLSPTGVKEGIERVKYLPAAIGSPGVRITFGKWTRNGWDGPGVWTGRTVAADFKSTELRHRVER